MSFQIMLHTVPTKRMEALGGEIKLLRTDSISIPENRARAISQKKVDELKEDLLINGLIHPITVKPDPGVGWVCIVGAHRTVAFQQLLQETQDDETWSQIPARSLASATDDDCRLIELSENVVRNDLTTDQRKQFAGEMLELKKRLGLLEKKVSEKSGVSGVSGSDTKKDCGPSWRALAKQTGIPNTTLQDWWSEYAQEEGIAGPPSKNPQAVTDRFIEWLSKATERKEQEEKKQERERLSEAVGAFFDKLLKNHSLEDVREAFELVLNDHR